MYRYKYVYYIKKIETTNYLNRKRFVLIYIYTVTLVSFGRFIVFIIVCIPNLFVFLLNATTMHEQMYVFQFSG